MAASSAINTAGNAAQQTAATNAGVSNGAPRERDVKPGDASTNAQFGSILQDLQSKYGAKPEKAREIKKTLGKDDFLRIMITQMKHQDPTNPFKAEQMATEMAQFTSVEQMQNMNQTLNKLVTANQPLERMAMTNLIGKTVTVDRGRFPHVEGQNDSLSYALSRDASDVKLTLVSAAGEVVFEKNLGAQKAGENTYSWDGMKTNGLPNKSGDFIMKIEAHDDRGGTIQTGSQAQARVIGLSFEGNEPVLLIGDAQRQEKVTMKNIVRIEDMGGAPAVPGATLGAQAGGGIRTLDASQSAPNFFTFQKGIGSTPVGNAGANPEVQAALAKYQQDAVQAQSQAKPESSGAGPSAPRASAPSVSEEKGFPNGLHDDPKPDQNEKGGKA
jgi:flagellar basal-body rod modification protein FlgD